MKLDKIGFAMVVAFVSEIQQRNQLDGHDINRLDDLIDIEVPAVTNQFVSFELVDELLRLMAAGTSKIETIKAYRILTNAGLKESKDAVEKYWVAKPPTLGDILNDAGR